MLYNNEGCKDLSGSKGDKRMSLHAMIAEATEGDFKVALEAKKPKSWLKSVSAFANGIGGSLFFGVRNDRVIIGLDNAQSDAETISRLIKERITPLPDFVLSAHWEEGKDILVLEIHSGTATPYYYKADGVMEAYIRVGNETILAPDYVLNELILKGTHRSFDSLVTDSKKADYSFTLFEATFLQRTGSRITEKDYVSFGLATNNGFLTNAGKLLADQHIIYNSRVFCTRWNGLTKGSVFDDALDDKEFEGNLIYLLQSGSDFIRNNSKVRFEKKARYRMDKPDYAERAVTEALVNALIHRDYLMMGSEVHIDMYDDRTEIYSPGGMYQSKPIQEYEIDEVESVRRNPIIADLFHRMKFMERRGSGIRKIFDETAKLPGYTDAFKPEVRSTSTSFFVVLKNVNYHGQLSSDQDTDQVSDHDTDQDHIRKEILLFCSIPRSKKEICEHTGYSNLTYFSKAFLQPLLESKELQMTIPDRPKSKNQKYVRA